MASSKLEPAKAKLFGNDVRNSARQIMRLPWPMSASCGNCACARSLAQALWSDCCNVCVCSRSPSTDPSGQAGRYDRTRAHHDTVHPPPIGRHNLATLASARAHTLPSPPMLPGISLHPTLRGRLDQGMPPSSHRLTHMEVQQQLRWHKVPEALRPVRVHKRRRPSTSSLDPASFCCRKLLLRGLSTWRGRRRARSKGPHTPHRPWLVKWPPSHHLCPQAPGDHARTASFLHHWPYEANPFWFSRTRRCASRAAWPAHRHHEVAIAASHVGMPDAAHNACANREDLDVWSPPQMRYTTCDVWRSSNVRRPCNSCALQSHVPDAHANAGNMLAWSTRNFACMCPGTAHNALCYGPPPVKRAGLGGTC